MGSNSSRTSTTTTEDSSTTSSTTPGTTTAAVCTQDGNECENGASCVLDPVSPANNFCKCVNGYFGKFCKGKHSDNNSSTINPVLPSDNNSNTVNPVLTNQESSPSSTTASSPATSSPSVSSPTASNPTANSDSSSSTTASKPITGNPKGDMWIIYEIVIPVVGAVLLIVSFAIYC